MVGGTEETVDLIFAGVGGQGVLLIAEITARSAARAGFEVKQTEVHGVSQRGGVVESHVRYGRQVHSPLVMPGRADVVVGLEKLEALRFASYVRRGGGGLVLANDHEIVPASVANAGERYPHHAFAFLEEQGVPLTILPATEAARRLGDGRMANMVLLGGLAARLDLPETCWLETLEERLPPGVRERNRRAFDVGRELVSRVRQGG